MTHDRTVRARGGHIGLALLAILLACSLCPLQPASAEGATGDVGEGEVVTWSGDVTVTGHPVVAEGGTLVIEAGARVRFDGGAVLTVRGTLLAVGSPEAPVRLEGTLMDVGGAGTGRDVLAVLTPASRLELAGAGADGGLLDRCDVASLAISIGSASPTVSNCTVTGNSRIDIAGACSPVVRGCAFSGNGVGDPAEPWYRTPYSSGTWGFMSAPTMVLSSGTTARVQGCNFSRNGGFGIDVLSASPTIEGNTFSGNREGGVRIDQAFEGNDPLPVLSCNTFRDHGLPGLLAHPPEGLAFDLPLGAVAAVRVDDADALFTGNLFVGNEVGVAVTMNFSGEPVFRGDVFRDNVVGVSSYKGSPELFDCVLENVLYDFWITSFSHVKAHNTTFDEAKLHIEPESRLEADGRDYMPVVGGVGLLGLLALLYLGATETGKAKLFALAFPLYSRMRGEDVLDQFTRGQIYGLVRGNPGIRYSEIKRLLLIGNGTLAHHLSVLEREGFIKARRQGLHKMFYPARLGARHMELEERFPTGVERAEGIRLSALQEDIVELVRREPGITQAQIVARLEVPKQTVSYNVGNLSSYGLLTVLEEANVTRCYVRGNNPAPE